MLENNCRIWNGKRMYYPGDTNVYLIDQRGRLFEEIAQLRICDCGDKRTFRRVIPRTDLKVMQGTGVQDRNGREIYEGDIADVEYIGKAIVEWHTGIIDINCGEYATAYCGWIADDSGNRDECGLSNEVTILGNIYENPELIMGGRKNVRED